MDRIQQSDRKSGSILLVEDDHEVRGLLEQILTLHGFDVLSASHGREALDVLAQASSVRMILLDLMMPVMDGFQFLQEKKLNASIRDIPVIVFSAADERSFPRSEVRACLNKPLSMETLVKVILDHWS